jgi:hypothetical protein
MAAATSSNSITIFKICCKFDTTYPDRLNGIIIQDEYLQSIANINHISMSYFISICVIFFVIPIIGTPLLIFWLSLFPSDFTLFFGVLILLLVPAILYVVLENQHSKQLKKVIHEESAKYVMRSPAFCTWRLEEHHVDRSTMRYVSNIVSTDRSAL